MINLMYFTNSRAACEHENVIITATKDNSEDVFIKLLM